MMVIWGVDKVKHAVAETLVAVPPEFLRLRGWLKIPSV